jgi:hypothetical protein
MTLVIGLALVVLGIYFVRVGLDRASKLSEVLGAFSAVIGLGLAAWGILLARSAASREALTSAGHKSQAVTNSTIGGDNIQIQIDGAGDVDAGRGKSK